MLVKNFLFGNKHLFSTVCHLSPTLKIKSYDSTWWKKLSKAGGRCPDFIGLIIISFQSVKKCWQRPAMVDCEPTGGFWKQLWFALSHSTMSIASSCSEVQPTFFLKLVQNATANFSLWQSLCKIWPQCLCMSMTWHDKYCGIWSRTSFGYECQN